MKRVAHPPRPDWQRKVESVGLTWHSNKGPYWNESAYYSFTLDEVNALEAATTTLHGMFLEAAQHIIDRRLYEQLRIPPFMVPLIEVAWQQEPPSLYGRFDLAYDGVSPPRMLEYNADTPTSLVEASLAQWFWLQDVFPAKDQFNALHERLIAHWRALAPYLQGQRLHFAGMDDLEDGMTLAYLRDTAEQAGIVCDTLTIGQIGLSSDGFFTDLSDRVIESLFKLYPWEWLVHEEPRFVEAILAHGPHMQWIEPVWKMLLSNKGLLAVLWELFPESPYLLPASFDVADTLLWDAFVRKPLLSREGANVTVTMFDQTLMESKGDYGEDGYVYQHLATIPNMGGSGADARYPVLGTWIIGDQASGMGIRESNRLITDNLSQFVPHVIEG
ncbi:MAG: glutathionylspermidine synthase family protein [Gemmatimonadetes bacterium]|nr:glutathionylspermidine synthase family protein [Gemmatimonadota bacterium]